MAETLLELAGISKTYPGVKALDDVSLRVYRGEVLGLISENGAGKSTLMRVLGGVIAPSDGVIRIGGKDHAQMTVSGATQAGIAFVHQELNLFENLDVAANVFIGREKRTGGPLKLVDDAGDSYEITAESVVALPMREGKARIHQAMTRFRIGDREALGLAEYVENG